MRDRRGVALGIAASVPAAACAIAAGSMLLAGDQRALLLEAALPGVIFGAGALLSVGAWTALALSGRTTRRRARQAGARAAEVAAAASAAAQAEREHHRRFLARLDHELKNPLTAIRATAAAAQGVPAGTDAAPADSAAWRTVDAQAQKLSALVRDLRKLAELEVRPLDHEPLDVEALVRDAIDALSQQQPSARGRITFVVTRVPWPVPTLSADHDLLSLAVDNVLANAVKYAPTAPIEVRLREDDGWIVLEVADAGRGVPSDDLPRVFDELARARNARDVGGTGLGLTLVATILRRHGGDATMRSVEGAGTVVTLRLPAPR